MTTVSPFSGSPASALEIPLASPAFSIPSSNNNNSNAITSTTTTKTTATATKTTVNGKPKSKPRKRVNTAEKRHQHNAIERQRRETLNGKFIVLARLLPALASHRRPSKSAIVNGSITHLTYQREQRLLAVNILRQMSAEHDELLKEVNEWRRTGGFAPKAVTNSWAETIEEIAGVEKEVFGTFANVDGEDEDGDDNENDIEPQFDQASFSALPVFTTTSTGLITPRPSTDITSAANMLPNVFATESRVPTASNTALNWSSDFAWSMNSQPPVATPTFPLGMYMGESLENATTESPATSQQGMVVTPPTYTEMMQNPSSSPGSSNGIAPSLEDVKPAANVQAAMSTWTPAQILFAHQQLQLQRQQQQQQQALRQQQQQQAAAAFASTFTPNGTNIADPDLDLFTQQLMSSMFNPTQAVPAPTQIEQWRRNALNSVPARPVMHHQTSVHDLRNAVRLGMGAAGVPGWQEQGVEGF